VDGQRGVGRSQITRLCMRLDCCDRVQLQTPLDMSSLNAEKMLNKVAP
jgi:hypothetical protein